MQRWDVVSIARKSYGVTQFYENCGVRFSGVIPRVSSYSPSHVASKRGRVLGFSSASSRRFRDVLLSTCPPPGYCPYSFTFTLRDVRSPDWWRKSCNVFAGRLRRAAVCGFWRVELQKRGTPHLHCVLYLPPLLRPAAVRDHWLLACGVFNSLAHRRHAVQYSSLDSAGWYNYVATHAVKHKADQLGWIGRQWGVYSRSLLRPRPYVLEILPPDAYYYGVRLYSLVLRFRCRSPVGRLNQFVRFCSDDESLVISRCMVRGLRSMIAQDLQRIRCGLSAALLASVLAGVFDDFLFLYLSRLSQCFEIHLSLRSLPGV